MQTHEVNGQKAFFAYSKNYFRISFVFNAGKVDAVAGNAPLKCALIDLFLTEISKSLSHVFRSTS